MSNENHEYTITRNENSESSTPQWTVWGKGKTGIVFEDEEMARIACDAMNKVRPDPLKKSLDSIVKDELQEVMAQRHSILKAFVAQHGLRPDEAEQIVQDHGDGTRSYRVQRREIPKSEIILRAVVAYDKERKRYAPYPEVTLPKKAATLVDGWEWRDVVVIPAEEVSAKTIKNQLEEAMSLIRRLVADSKRPERTALNLEAETFIKNTYL